MNDQEFVFWIARTYITGAITLGVIVLLIGIGMGVMNWFSTCRQRRCAKRHHSASRSR